MTSFLTRFFESLVGSNGQSADTVLQPASPTAISLAEQAIAPTDPLLAFLRDHPEAVELTHLDFDSPAVRDLRRAGVRVVAPLVCRGELVGLLQLGPRMGTLDYSPDDFNLLNNLVTQAAPALRVAQLAELQKSEALINQQREHELRMARLIQHTLLPKDLPQLPGWQMAAFYRPAREVGGDFYDFVRYPDGRLAFIIGDVTDKGMPAALLMATTRATLRAVSSGYLTPGEVLEITNEMLCPDVPPSMFITCQYLLLDPNNGRLTIANAGHNLPYRFGGGQVEELRATGMPLGLLPGMRYEEREANLLPGDHLLLYSDGLVEAHNPLREMFGNPRLEAALSGDYDRPQDVVDDLLSGLEQFSGAGWEQEDDVTLVSLQFLKEGSKHGSG